MGWLDGRVALVSGGGSGIGRAVVERFIEEGARVGIIERVPERVQELKATLGGKVCPVQGDVTKLEDNDRAVRETVSAFGKLDIFVGNAAVFDFFMSLADFPRETFSAAFDELFGVNVKGYLFGAKAALPELIKTEGCIVYTVSNAGFYPGGGGPLYTASKHAVVGLVRQLAYELAPKIRVNGVAPGGTRTDLRGLSALGQAELSSGSRLPPEALEGARMGVPLQIFAEPKDHAGAYVYLASKENTRAVTGTIIESTGGIGVRGLFSVAGGTNL